MNDNRTPHLAKVIAFPTRKAMNAPQTNENERQPQATPIDTFYSVMPARSVPMRDQIAIEAPRPFPYVRVAVSAASISFLSLIFGSLVGTAAAVYVGILSSCIGLFVAHALNVRARRLRLEQLDRQPLDARPMAMLNPANLLRLGMGWYVPLRDNANAKHSLALMAPAVCHPLGEVAGATVMSGRVPSGIKYSAVKFAPRTEDGKSILVLMLQNDDEFGRKYHDKLREDLIECETESLDIELEFKDGRTCELLHVERFRPPQMSRAENR